MRVIAESELIINSDGSIFHLHMRPEQLAGNVILVGDPGRVAMVAAHFDSVECEGSSREFNFKTGTYRGVRFTVLSTGIGTDNIDIVVNELDALVNIDFKTRQVKEELTSLNILRIGTCGAVQPDIPLGSYIFSHISVGADGLMNWYAGRDEVTIPDMEKAFVEQVGYDRNLGRPYFIKADQKLIDAFADCSVKGMTVAAQGFYGPQGRYVRIPLAMPDMLEKFAAFSHDGYRITNFEMEGSAVAALSRKLGHRAGTICLVVANRYHKGVNPDYKELMNKLVVTALDRLAALK